ncbi:MAG TPA: type III polyketide synthase [Bdellovibrionales bacterium]|nr:type III polyketide synthase [Bdellovibrionales bacterium]
MSSYLNRIVTSVPQHEVHEKFVSYIPQIVQDERMRKLFSRLASKCHIERRYSVVRPALEPDRLDADGFFTRGEFPSTQSRMKFFEREAMRLAEKPIETVLEKVDRSKITHLIVTSCTGFYAPGLDLEIQKHFGLRSDLERTSVGFMGCFAAINALKLADHIVRARADATVLLVNLELCTLHLQESTEPEQLMAFLQFADGCAVSLVSSDASGLRLDGFHARVFEDGKDLIQWHIGDTGFNMILSADVPKALGRSLQSAHPKFIDADQRANTKLWAVHPGGRSILDAVQTQLGLTDSEMSFSRNTLRNFGNMSSATVLFVLSDMLAEPALHGDGVAMAFGPGLTVESMRFHKAIG